jgi:predicted RNase H-like HicB family nuclease
MANEKTAIYTVRVHPDADGLWAEVVELPGCFAAGSTLDELWESIQEGIGLYLSNDDKRVVAEVLDKEHVIEEHHEFRLLCNA